ncbi:MAG: hypothetical protein CMO01_01095 [Thalassobius sp.]|nr:hypothetical protein [Thalassovita sp.]
MKKLYLIYILFSAVILSSCEDNLLDGVTSVPTDPAVVPATAGSADFTNYVAIGNSLTAGYMDGALYTRGQSNSFPVQLSSSMAEIDGTGAPSGTFNQPDINSENGYFGMAGSVILGRLKLNSSSLPEPLIPGEIPTVYTGDKTELNNFGVPGILLGQLVSPETGNPNSALYNPLYARFATQPGVSTILGDALSTLPSFFTLWIGGNDVLGYAISGATNEAIFTDPATFEYLYSLVLQSILATGAKGVVANIPNITDVPFFNTIGYNFLSLDSATAAQLNAGYAEFNGGIQLYNSTPGLPESQQRPTVSFQEGANAFLIEDEDLPDLTAFGIPSIRQMTADEMVGMTVPQDSISTWLMNGEGIPDEYILTSIEIEEINQRVIDLNTIIANLVTSLGGDNVGLVDINSIFQNFASSGITRYYDVTVDATLAPPFGLFSLDGVHPNSRGSAFVANQFIDVINSKFNSTLPYVELEAVPINDFPPTN